MNVTRSVLGHYVRAGQCYEFNSRYFPTILDPRWPQNPAVMMTAINLAEFQGFLRGYGPVRVLSASEKAQGYKASPNGLYVGNDNGTVDATGWQLNGTLSANMLPEEAVKRAFALWSTSGKKDPFEHWYAYKDRAKKLQDWEYFLSIATDVPNMLKLPIKWAEAQGYRKTK